MLCKGRGKTLEQRKDLRTFLRVHGIPGIMDYVAYTEDLPLVFYNCNNEEGIVVDGVHEYDTFQNYFCPWEFVTGRVGSLLQTYQLDTNLGDYLGIPNDLLPETVLASWFYGKWYLGYSWSKAERLCSWNTKH